MRVRTWWLCAALGLALIGPPADAKSPRKAAVRQTSIAKPVRPEGIEQSYARLCAGEAATGDAETCAALKQAMIAKLTGGKAADPSPAIAASQGAKPFGLSFKDDLVGDGGIEISNVAAGSAAAAAGLLPGDLLFWGSAGGSNAQVPFRDPAAFAQWAAGVSQGSKQKILYQRNGKSAYVTLASGSGGPVSQDRSATSEGIVGPGIGGLLSMLGGANKPAAAGSTVAGSGLERTVTAPYGQTTKFDLKMTEGQLVEVEVVTGSSDGVIFSSVCRANDSFWGVNSYCLAPGVISKSTTVYRHRAPRNGTLQIKLKTKGGAGSTYSLRTMEVRAGGGAAVLRELGKMAGRSFFGAGTVDGIPVKVALAYAVEEPDRSGVVTFRDESGKTDRMRVVVDNAGDAAFTLGSTRETGAVRLGVDGLVYFHFAGGRSGYGMTADGKWISSWQPKVGYDGYGGSDKTSDAGSYSEAGRVTVPPTTEREIAAMIKAGPARIAAAKAKRFLQWGALRTLAGKTWGFADENGRDTIVAYAWDKPEQSMTVSYWTPAGLGLAPYVTGRLTHNPSGGGFILGTFGTTPGSGTLSLTLDPDGALIQTNDKWVSRLTVADDGSVEWRYLKTPSGQPIPPSIYRPIAPAQIAALTQQARSYREQQAAAQQAQQQSQGVNLFNTLNAIRNAGSIDGAFNQGMVQMLNQKAPGLGDIYGAAASPGGLKGAGGGGGGSVNPLTGMRIGGSGGGRGGAGGGGPNLAIGPHCPGFTEANYRSHAFNGGRDQQLYALCGQAFEYYHMYQNAVQQGDPDAGRTYQAHSDAVRQIKQFVAEAR